MLTRLLLTAARYSSLRALYSCVASLPLVGTPARDLIRRLLPPGRRLRTRISAGLGKGLWLNIDPRYEVAYLAADYEAEVQNALRAHLLPGATFYDIGAHIGFFSVLAARLVGEGGRVFAFEADPENAARIQEHAQMNSLPQIQVIPLAVWSENRRLSFQRASRFSSRNIGAVLDSAAPAAGEDVIEVEAITLDSFIHDHAPPQLIKADVEGGEVAVLQGARELLARHKPRVICEVHSDHNLEILRQQLEAQGFRLETLAARHILISPAP